MATFQLEATHNRSGEITYEQIGPLTIRATITTYTKASSEAADRDSLELFWGDGASEFVLRSNGNGQLIPGTDVKKNLYIKEHTYPGRATYTLSFTDPNRVSGILNVNYPNSVDVPFYLETTFTLLNPQFDGENSSAILLQPPLDFACVGQRFIHNPNAFDPDGDSLAYELVVPLSSENNPVPQYQFPDAISPGPNNAISLDPNTGDFVWESPQSSGEYNIAIRINEYRNGDLINSIIRDMQIFVGLCNYRPPVITTENEICVIAGERIELDLLVTDMDVEDLVSLTATGGPFNVELSPAELQVNTGFLETPINAKFVWQTTCEHISPYAYQVVFRAQDNSEGSQGLADLKTVQISVLGPPPRDVQIENQDQDFLISWEKPYACEDAADDYFLGFSVWRREGSNNFELDECSYGLEGKGYEIVEFLTSEFQGNRYQYVDRTTEDGKLYCYRVLGEFALKTNTGNPFNRVQSIPSEEVCKLKQRDFPFLLNVSVESTSNSDGEIFVKWNKPDAEDLDTMLNSGSYDYQLLASEAGSGIFNPVTGANFSSNTFGEEIDTMFTHTGLNTRNTQYEYMVEFTANGSGFRSESPSSSSLFLTVTPFDESNRLSWNANTSWQNYSFTIYRLNELSGSFDSIGQTTSTMFIDNNLNNGESYCYRIRSTGAYGIGGIEEPLFNFSQEACGIPVDIQAPCQIPIRVDSPCAEVTDEDEIINQLNWNNATIFCDNAGDAVLYNIYYSNGLEDDLVLLETIDDISVISSQHEPTTGSVSCYAISVVDSLGNESELSELVCVDNCPSYELPNTFTPNDDGFNDLFIPVKNRFISQVNMKVYNRWGNLVFQTDDPQINWDGKNLSGSEVEEGAYHYSCEVFETKVSDLNERREVLEGFIQVIRSN